MLLVPFQGRFFNVFSAIKSLDDVEEEEEDEEGVHMCASSIAQHFLPKNPVGRQITISPHFLDSVTRNLLVFWKHEREAPHGRRKRRRRRGAIG